jgi:hypothetical protein
LFSWWGLFNWGLNGLLDEHDEAKRQELDGENDCDFSPALLAEFRFD